MKTWKLVSGILSIVMCVVVGFQSCAATLVNAMGRKHDDLGGSYGFILGVLMLSAGIVAIATRNSKGIGGDISILLLYGGAAFVGLIPFLSSTIYQDLIIWAGWCGLCALIAFINLITYKPQPK